MTYIQRTARYMSVLHTPNLGARPLSFPEKKQYHNYQRQSRLYFAKQTDFLKPKHIHQRWLYNFANSETITLQ